MVEETKVTHDNNGRFYRIKMDLAKEGSEIWDLTPYFKGRVGDNRFGLQVVWTYQGRLLDTIGMKPYIEGNVGNYSFDDKKDLQLAPDAATVCYTGNPSDCQAGGQATYYFPEQMFPRDGIFKGYIGLLDDRDSSSQPHISGVTIWFKVLPGISQMGHACDVYISDLDKALQNFKVKLDQHDKDYQTQLQQVIDDARNTYNQEIENTRSSLQVLNSEIDENRQFQHNLNDQLKGTQDQIRINDVVKRQEFEDLSGKINEQLAHMNFKPNYYANYEDMVAQNPSGTHDACVTADNYHIWLYNFDTNQWRDCGQVSNYGLDPQTESALGGANNQNLVFDSNFKLNNSWTNGGNGKPLVADINNHLMVGNSNVMTVSEIDKGASFTSKDIPVKGFTQISYGALVNLTHAVGEVFISIWGKNETNNYPISRLKIENDNDDDLHLRYSTYCNIPAGTKSIRLAFELNDKGTLQIARPQIYIGTEWIPYDHKELHEEIVHAQDININENNLLSSKDLNHFSGFPHSDYLTLDLLKDPFFQNSDVAKITNTQDKAGTFTTPTISNDNTADGFINFGFWAKTTDPKPFINFWWTFTGGNQGTYNPKIEFKNDNKWHFYKVEGILVGTNVKSFRIDVGLSTKSTMQIARPQLNWGTGLLPYSSEELKEELNENLKPLTTTPKNEILDYQFKTNSYWKNASNGLPIQSELVSDDKALGANVLQLTEVDKGGSYNTPDIDVGSHHFFNYGALATVTEAKGATYIGVWDDRGQLFDKIFIPNTEGKVLQKYEKQNIRIPDGVKKIHLSIALSDKGTLKIAIPFLAFGKRYSSSLPIIDICTDETINADWVKAPFIFKDKERTLEGYMQVAIQGDSSRLFPKKNYKIKTFSDSEYKEKLNWRPKSSWNSNNKFNLKANWVDATQARNLTNARIFERATDITPFENSDVAKKLSKAQAMGQMEGFPIELYLNGQYNGLYTLNTKKDDKTFGMNSDIPGEEAIVFEQVDSQLKKYPTKFDGTDYSTIVQDKPDATLKSNFDNFIQFLNTASDDDLKNKLSNYIDVHSVMNTYLWGVLAEVWDTSAKSNLLLTYDDGKYFYMIPYDMDSTWSLKPDGNIYPVPLPEYDFKNIDNDQYMQFVTEKNDMKIFNILYRLFKPELKEQYFKLRQDVWSNSKIIDEYKEFINSIPQEAYQREHIRWPQVPSYKEADFSQLQNAIIQRGADMDKFMQNLVPETDPLEEIKARLTNLEHNGTTQK